MEDEAMFLKDYIKDVFGALKSLATGMKRTGYYFTHHKEIITQQYPDNRDTLVLPERFKGEVVMIHDITNMPVLVVQLANWPAPTLPLKSLPSLILMKQGRRKKQLTHLYIILNYVRCAICVWRLVLQVQLKWHKLLNIVCLTGAS